ncbi:reverse transcriptase-like protein [Rhizorhabdus argentea]|uniref:reverse transcriptase-like protein n=1 Tax=Rhizorhabdus argentea TaxID=1387174 RepID=UPI0030EBE32B
MNEKHSHPVKLWFDGGCRPNPGPMESAVVLRGVADIRRGLGEGGNEQAEWLALLHALEVAARHGLRDIIVIGDSLSVIRQARGDQAAPSSEASACLQLFRKAMGSFDRVRLRHTRRAQNLAGVALERARWQRTNSVQPAMDSSERNDS